METKYIPDIFPFLYHQLHLLPTLFCEAFDAGDFSKRPSLLYVAELSQQKKIKKIKKILAVHRRVAQKCMKIVRSRGSCAETSIQLAGEVHSGDNHLRSSMKNKSYGLQDQGVLSCGILAVPLLDSIPPSLILTTSTNTNPYNRCLGRRWSLLTSSRSSTLRSHMAYSRSSSVNSWLCICFSSCTKAWQ